MSWRRVVAAWAGPLLIVSLVLFALRGFVFEGRLTNGHPDILAFWLPRWSFLGRSLADGTIPLWNPFEMTGYRFAADPQSGWLHVSPMVLFSVLSSGTAMIAMIALQPALAGLGLYGFLRIEGLGRVAAAVGGLAIAGAMAQSEIAIAMPFAGALAWGTITLLAAAGFVRAERWPRRLMWIALGGFAWSQVASAHLSHGLVAVTAVLLAYVAARTTRDGRRRSALFVLALPVLSIAVLAPRLQFISVSSLADGYSSLATVAVQGEQEPPILESGVWAGWPLVFGAAPGAYLGAIALVAAPLAWRDRRRRRVVVAFALVLGATWLLLLPLVLGTGLVRDLLLALPFGDVMLHNPGRLRYVALLTLPVLAAIGVHGVIDDPPPLHRLLAWCAGGAALWIGTPLLAGGDPVRWRLVGLMVVPAVVSIVVIARRARWAPALAAVLALELATGASMAGRHTGDEIRYGLEGSAGTPLAFQPLRTPDVDPDAYVRRTAFVDLIGEDRYLTWAPPAAAYVKGYLFAQEPTDWPALANERGTLFGIRDALGYNPVQLPTYWHWIRERNPLPIYYNASVLARPTLEDLEILGVRYMVVPSGVTPTVRGEVVAAADGYDLVEVSYPLLHRLTTPVTVQRRSSTEFRVEAEPPAGGVVIHETFDPGWRATSDGGSSARVEPYGPVMQLLFADGTNGATLTYRDPWVVGSLWAGALTWLALAGGIAVTRRRERELARGATS